MLPHAVAVAPDVDDVAVVEQPIDERGGHDLVAEDVPSLLEALVGGEDDGADLVAPVDELEEEGDAGAGDGDVSDLVDDPQRRVGEDLEPAGGLCLLEGGDGVSQRPIGAGRKLNLGNLALQCGFALTFRQDPSTQGNG